MGGYIRADQPCPRCGWKYKGWHVCFDASKKVPGEGQLTLPEPQKVDGRSTPDRKSRASRSQAERWERKREENRPRDEAIVQSYKDGATLRALESSYSLSFKTVMSIIKRHEEETGETVMREPGRKKREKETHGGFN